LSESKISRDDKFDIMELIARYNHAIDGGDPDGVADCFLEDGIFQGRSGRFVGRAELRKLGMTLTPSCLPRHMVNNVLIDGEPGQPDVARIKSHLCFYEIKPEGFHFKTSGVYTDVVVRTPQGWKFKTRLMTLDVAKPE
jgi:hypothetical protein